MRKSILFATLVAFSTMLLAQKYPTEWTKFTTDAYYHDIESASDKQTAIDLARTNLAKQIQVIVKEVSQKDLYVVDGKTSSLFNSQKSISTNLDMSLAEIRSHYNDELGKYYVLAFINKSEACTFYETKVKMIVSNTTNSIQIADNYINNGFKSKAKNELQNALSYFEDAANPFFWLNVFSFDKQLLQQYLDRINSNEQYIKQKLAELEYGTTYCIVCDADLFGQKYVKLKNEIKGDLSTSGCNFVDDPASADYVINIRASARKYNEFQGAYFSYIDAALSIEKKATNQRIYEDELSIKGSHTLGYSEAARDGYKRIRNEISKLLKENIKQ